MYICVYVYASLLGLDLSPARKIDLSHSTYAHTTSLTKVIGASIIDKLSDTQSKRAGRVYALRFRSVDITYALEARCEL